VFLVPTFCHEDVAWIQSLTVSFDSVRIISKLISSPAVRNRLWNSAGFFLIFWGVHYAPFFLMSRQLFLHHYLPSHLASAMIAGAVLNFILSDTINYPISIRGPKTRNRPTQYSEIGLRGPILVAVCCVFQIIMFIYMSPLTYGSPG
jgi:dolichyl-phosphate-mannose-protein mannosyltransferase